MTGSIVNDISSWPVGTFKHFWNTYFEYIHHITHWAHCDRISPNVQNVLVCLRTRFIGVTWLGTFKIYSTCTHWAYWGHMAGYIQNVLSMYPLGTLESHVDCALNVFTIYLVGIWAPVPSVYSFVKPLADIAPSTMPKRSCSVDDSNVVAESRHDGTHSYVKS